MAETTAVKMPDGTTLQFPSTMTREAMQTAAAGWWQQNGGQAASAPAAPQPAPTPATQDPMLPSPDTDTRSTQDYLRDTGATPEHPLIDARAALAPRAMRTDGGAAMDLARSGMSGLARGATELAALPATIGGGLDALYERAGIIPQGSRENVPSVGGVIRGATSGLTSGATEYEPQTTGGEYAQTVGEFVGGGAGPKAGLLGGLLSEGAGQLTEGTAAEPYARIAGGIVGGMAGTPRNLPFAGDDEAARMARTLQQGGVNNITAGQARQSQPLMRMEGRLQPTAGQLDDFTAATMRQIGSDKPLATPENLRAIEQSIVGQMDDAIQGVSIAPNTRHAQAATQIAADYVDRVPAGSLTPRVRGIGQEIASASRQGGAVGLDKIKQWRSDIGRLTVSPDAATREAAHGMRRLLDDMTDTALTQAGRADDIQSLASARQSYRDFIAVRDAASRAGAEGGTLSPTQLNQSVIRSQGREAYATGRTTPFADFTRAGASTFRSAPATNPGGARTISESLPLAGGAVLGGGALQAGLSPVTAGLLAAGGVLAPTVGQSAMRSAPIQGLLTNPATVFGQATRTTPGLLAQ